MFLRFVRVISWYPSAANRPIFPPLAEVYSDFEGRELTIVGMDLVSFAIFERGIDDVIIPKEGVDIEICKILAKKLNFT